MKKVIYSLLAGAMMLASCSDFTEIQQKGKNLLQSTDDLELLLNVDYNMNVTDLNNLGGELIYTYSDMGAAMALQNKTRRTYVQGFFDSPDELTRFAILTTSDSHYTYNYSQIGKVCNPILSQVDAASGPEAKKAALKAEAYAWRAYCHFLVLQKFAKAYNPATADKDGGIIYMTEDCDIQTPQEPKSVKECYELCLKDINAAIDLNALPEKAASNVRMNKPAAYAVKAHICMAMQDYAGAQQAADAALALNNKLHDFYADAVMDYSMGGVPFYYSPVDCMSNEENYMSVPMSSFLNFVSPQAVAEAEKGYAMLDLMNYLNNMYLGVGAVMPAYAAYEDYGSLYGLSGWKCTYSLALGNYWNASGLSTPVMYILKAECQLRSNDIDGAMASLDIVRKNRLPEDSYAPLKGTVTTKADAIAKIKQINVGENLWGPWLFIQRKRWNVENDWKTTITHTIAGQTRTLSPESNLWVFPFPTSVLEKNPNLKNNTNK